MSRRFKRLEETGAQAMSDVIEWLKKQKGQAAEYATKDQKERAAIEKAKIHSHRLSLI